MVVVKLAGGLGNQMFEYAAAKALALHHNCEIKADLSFLLDRTNKDPGFVFRDYDLDIFNLQLPVATIEEIKQLTERSTNKSANKFCRCKRG